MEIFGKICFGLFALITGIVVGGFVFMKLWLWIPVPIFGVKEINWVEAMAVAFFISVIKAKVRLKKDSDTENDFKLWLLMMTFYSVSLGFGWIFKMIL